MTYTYAKQILIPKLCDKVITAMWIKRNTNIIRTSGEKQHSTRIKVWPSFPSWNEVSLQALSHGIKNGTVVLITKTSEHEVTIKHVSRLPSLDHLIFNRDIIYSEMLTILIVNHCGMFLARDAKRVLDSMQTVGKSYAVNINLAYNLPMDLSPTIWIKPASTKGHSGSQICWPEMVKHYTRDFVSMATDNIMKHQLEFWEGNFLIFTYNEQITGVL